MALTGQAGACEDVAGASVPGGADAAGAAGDQGGLPV